MSPVPPHLKAQARATVRREKRLRWTKARNAERGYASRLRAVATQVGQIVAGLAPGGDLGRLHELTAALRRYAEIIDPWARSVARLMVEDVARRDKAMWRKQNTVLGRELVAELASAPTGATLAALQSEQVRLIKSLPLQAAERVHEMSATALVESGRAAGVAEKIAATGHVTQARAMLIARTEVARVSSNLVQARSQYAGSEGYIWRTSEDADVRESHAKMEGTFVRWDTPPKLDNLVGHAGTLPNCRCFAEPVFPDD